MKVQIKHHHTDSVLFECKSPVDMDSGVHLHGANLSNANLHGAILSGADLSGANLIGTDLSNADLSNDGCEYEFNEMSGDKKEW